MLHRFFYHLTFMLERFIVRGAFHQLLFIAATIVLVSFVSGTIVFLAVPDFGGYWESVWWGFLRLTDPGYLGDDEGIVARSVSTVVTVLGYVLFMGALIAIMTQGLGRLMRVLESGVTPITENNHILILGWNNRTATIVKELLLSKGRMRRFLGQKRADRLLIVVLAERVTAELAYDFRAALGQLWDPAVITLRSGNPLRMEHLARTDFLNAAAIILPAGDIAEGSIESLDARTVKTLLSISKAAETAGMRKPPPLTAEFFDARKIAIARAGYSGDAEIFPSSTVISRLLAQNVRHSGLSYVYSELLTHGAGNEIYVREFPEFAGRSFASLQGCFPTTIPLGVMRMENGGIVPWLNPSADFVLKDDDRCVFMAEGYEKIVSAEAAETAEVTGVESALVRDAPIAKHVLLLGWSHKLPALLTELQTYTNENFSVTAVSLIPAEERRAHVERFAGDISRVEIEYVEADYTAPNDLKELRPGEYDNVVFLASDWLASGEESDARTILGYLLLRTLILHGSAKPQILIELLDADNQDLFADQAGEVLISPLMLSHMLTQVTLRRDLALIFDELFTTGGAEIYFHSPQRYRLDGAPRRFRDIQRAVAAQGNIALGVYLLEQRTEGTGALRLNPPRESEWTLSPRDELVVLTTYA